VEQKTPASKIVNAAAAAAAAAVFARNRIRVYSPAVCAHFYAILRKCPATRKSHRVAGCTDLIFPQLQPLVGHYTRVEDIRQPKIAKSDTFSCKELCCGAFGLPLKSFSSDKKEKSRKNIPEKWARIL
jgi:hypothetical protein